MWYFVIIVSVIWVGVFIWSRIDYKRRNKEREKKKDKPPFCCEDKAEGYEKPLKDEDYNPVDLDDAE